MKRLRAIWISGALSVLALTGCGLTASPADGLTFTAPAGWQSSPGILGFMQFWHPASNDDEVLMLFKSPKPISTNEIFQKANISDMRVSHEQKITICGAQPALYLEGEATSSSVNNNPSKPHDMQMVMTNAAGSTYFAMYVYPVSVRPNAEAVASLRQLCAKPA